MLKQVPNILTIVRLLMAIPALILFSWTPMSPKTHLILLMLVIVAAITDWIDGWWARKFNCISDFGKIHDPLADKWLAVLFVPLVAINMIHFLPVATLWIRDITSTHLRIGLNRPMPARWSGKIKTIISFPLLCLLIATMPVEDTYFGLFIFMREFLYWTGGLLLTIVCIWSGIDYYWQVVITEHYLKQKQSSS